MTDTTAAVPTGTAVPHTDDDFDDVPPQQTPAQGNPAPDDDALGDAGKKAIDRMKAEKAEAVKRAKTLERELEQYKQASMSDTEKAISEAEKRGKQAATAEYGKRLARAQFDVLAVKRNPDVNTDDIVEFVDMGRFIGDDGDVDRKALQAAVDRLVAAPVTTDPSFDGGARTTAAKPADMNTIIRNQALGRRNT